VAQSLAKPLGQRRLLLQSLPIKKEPRRTCPMNLPATFNRGEPVDATLLDEKNAGRTQASRQVCSLLIGSFIALGDPNVKSTGGARNPRGVHAARKLAFRKTNSVEKAV
jgi:hypothetical protein